MTSSENVKCKLCDKTIPPNTEMWDMNICAVHYKLCNTCHNKLYYHFKDIIIDKIKYP